MMKIVLHCAASKGPDAGSLTDECGTPVLFVVDPALAPYSETYIYAPLVDSAGNGRTWRDVLVEYNDTGVNPLGLRPAYRMYHHQVYKQLVDRYGGCKAFILAAGWSLLSTDFLKRKYDISFSNRADNYKRRSKRDRYNEFRVLLDDSDEEVVFFGGKDYRPLFCKLTRKFRGRRFLCYNSRVPPEVPGCMLIQ